MAQSRIFFGNTAAAASGSRYTLSAGTAAFTITGTAASLEYGRLLSAASASFLITGTDASLEAGRRISADSTAFLITGTDASLESGRVLSAESAAFVITPFDATLVHTEVADTPAADPSGGWLWDWSPTPKVKRKAVEEDEDYEGRLEAERLAAHLIQQRLLDAKRRAEEQKALSDTEAVELMLSDLLANAQDYQALSEAYWQAELIRLEKARLRIEDEAAFMCLLTII